MGTPRDLAGILNANAAYTFCLGIQQLGFGGFMATSSGWPLPIEQLIPLSISSVSLILSMCNVFLDFSQMLTEIEHEQRLANNLESDSAGDLAAEKSKLEQQRKTKIE